MLARSLSAAAAIAFCMTAVQPVEARRSAEASASRTITACSKYGSKCISAKVRVTDLGLQYLSPGGMWTWCEHDCRDTLRRDTIDFWDDQRERSK